MTEGNTRTIRTMCPMNCHPTLCGMLAEVRDGNLQGVRGDPENPDSAGFLCVRGKASREVYGNPERLLHPLLREERGQDFRQVGWDEALDFMADRIRGVGREALGLWSGHGIFTTNYGTRINGQLTARFANLYGCQWWHPAMICWGMGAFGAGLTGVLEVHTKEDMAAHAEMVLLWGANLPSQPNTARHVVAARKRGAHIVAIDVRRTETMGQAHHSLIVRPGSDAALALAMMHVIIGEGLHDGDFVAAHTEGFAELAQHVAQYTPEWAAGQCGLPSEEIAALARRYAATRPAMIVMGGSSMHKGPNGWQAARAISCLPALTGNLGIPGGGLGPRHGGGSHGQALHSVAAPERKPPGNYIANQMSEITASMHDGRLRALLLLGTNMVSSYPDADSVAKGLAGMDLVVSHDLFLNSTAREHAHVVLPSTAWLEELGAKMSSTHLYLMEQALEPPGETRPVEVLLDQLARRLGVEDFFPWANMEALIDTVVDHPYTNHASVTKLRQAGGILPVNAGPVAHADHRYTTPSRKVALYSEQAAALGLPPLPLPGQEPEGEHRGEFPLLLTQGRDITHFHGFYNSGQALPSLARHGNQPALWMAPQDALFRGLKDGDAIRIHNHLGGMDALATVTERIPPGVVWMRDGWPGLNRLCDGAPILPEAALEIFGHFSAGQATFMARVEVERA